MTLRTMRRPVFIDTDVGLGTPGAEIDDGAALLVLLRAPQVTVVGCGSVHGNVEIEAADHNLRRILAAEDRGDLPVGRGAALPLLEDPAWFANWKAGYGPTEPLPGSGGLPPTAALLIDAARAHPGALTVLAVGPLTNLALAARLAPDIVPLVREVVTMGGAFGGEDDAAQATTAEFNARCDPEAAAIVLGAGWPVRCFGLEITRRVHFSRADFAGLTDTQAVPALLKRQASGWIDRVEAQGWEHDGCSLHDAVAAAALVDETLAQYRAGEVSVELTERGRRGCMQLRPRADGRVRVAVDLDVARCKHTIWSAVAGS
ncbi:MAG: nucleoside hydrolase [Anaerolineales bacterium]|nr:nucleoside hydrolase [Anaerolineales bacterium]